MCGSEGAVKVISLGGGLGQRGIDMSSLISGSAHLEVHGPVPIKVSDGSAWLRSVGSLLGVHGQRGGRRRGSMRVEWETRVGSSKLRIPIRVEVGSIRPLALPLVAIGVVHVVGDFQQVQKANGSSSR